MSGKPKADERRVEALAEYAHEAWSGWMRYLFDQSQQSIYGGVYIPREKVDRWRLQMTTPYEKLPEEEKESDRAEARKILAIIEDVD